MTARWRQKALIWTPAFLRVLIPLVSGIVTSRLLSEAWKYRDKVIGALPVWGTVLAIVIAGIGLYAIRSRFRLFYGINETLVGFYATWVVFVPRSYDYPALSQAEWLHVVAGLYIVVRGLDNISKGLEGKSFQPAWRWVFGKHA